MRADSGQHRQQDKSESRDKREIRENQRNSMRMYLEVLSSFDLIITSTSDSECV